MISITYLDLLDPPIQTGLCNTTITNAKGNMEIANHNTDKDAEDSLDRRAKSSHRMHYEAQVEVIRRQLGDLKKIRQNLGLSQRKICQLLMVDPSAWTRWTKQGD